jgi:hypothetical protein
MFTRICRTCRTEKSLDRFVRYCGRKGPAFLHLCRDCWGERYKNRSHGPGRSASSPFVTPAAWARRFAEGQSNPLAASLRATFE